MSRYTPATRLWICVVAITAAAAAIAAIATASATQSDWLILGLLASTAAVTHRFPIRSADGSATFAATNILFVAGAIILPPGLASLLPVLALTPQSWTRRHVAGEPVRWIFNTAQATLAEVVAASLVAAAAGRSAHDPFSLTVDLVAAGMFVVLQATLVGIVIAFNSHVHLLRAATFARPALLGEATKAVLGVAVAGLWLADPGLLVIVPLLLLLSHQLTRTAHLAHFAELDPKTGLHNARHFEEALEQELAHSRRLKRPLAVLFCDLDHFKRINDHFGHDTGDDVLRNVATLIRAQLRKGDVVARFGGEEFVALLPGTDAEHAMHLAERIRAGIAEHEFAARGGRTLPCSISIGVAVSPDDGADGAALVRAADQAMYRAKQTRNTVARALDAPLPVTRRVGDPRRLELVPPGDPWQARVLMWMTVAASAGAGAWGVATLWAGGTWEALLPLVGLAVLAEVFPVRIYEARRQTLSFSLGAAIILAAVGVEPGTAPLVGLAAGAAHALTSRKRTPAKVLFGLSNLLLAGGAAGFAYAQLRPAEPGFDVSQVSAAAAAVLAFLVTNTGLVALMVAMHSRRPLVSVVRESAWLVPTNVLLGLTGAFVGIVHAELGVAGAAIFGVPVLLTYWTLDFYARRSRAVIRILEHQAHHDPLTELPNRSLLQERLQEVLDAGGDRPVAVLLLDLDRFQEINDTFGHEAGDLLLRQVGQRLGTMVRRTDTLARLGGDEFGALLPTAGAADCGRIADAMRRALAKPFTLGGHHLEVSASLGAAIGPEHGCDATTLLRHADVALAAAKHGHSGAYTMYAPDQDIHSPERLELVGDLRQAIERDSLELVYQPKLDASSGRVVGVEALLRWQHARHGFIPPDQFVPVAEHTGLIRPLTHWVLRAALRQCRVWLTNGYVIPVAVNVSVHDLHDRSFPDVVAAALEASAVPVHCLRIEITEGAMMLDLPRTTDVLGRLRALGIGLSVDDFGTGYASLAYLKRLPIDELKIDRGFVRDLSTDASDAAIVEATIALGHKLGLKVVAEGVEDLVTRELLGTFGCDQLQGYLVSRPLAPAEFIEWLRSADGNRQELAAA